MERRDILKEVDDKMRTLTGYPIMHIGLIPAVHVRTKSELKARLIGVLRKLNCE